MTCSMPLKKTQCFQIPQIFEDKGGEGSTDQDNAGRIRGPGRAAQQFGAFPCIHEMTGCPRCVETTLHTEPFAATKCDETLAPGAMA